MVTALSNERQRASRNGNSNVSRCAKFSAAFRMELSMTKFYNIVSLHLIILIIGFLAIGRDVPSYDYGKLCILKSQSPFIYDHGKNCINQ
jgi:hypothetical protein